MQLMQQNVTSWRKIVALRQYLMTWQSRQLHFVAFGSSQFYLCVATSQQMLLHDAFHEEQVENKLNPSFSQEQAPAQHWQLSFNR